MTKKISTACFSLALAVLFSVPLQAQAGKVGTGRNDQQIQDEVTKLLSSKDKWKGATASTDDGIVTLEGTVKLFIDKLDVAKKVDKLKNVAGVRNHIQVEGNVPDSELQAKLADKLRYDRVGYGILFNNLTLKVQDGVVTIGGDVHDYPSRDSAIAVAETTPGVKDVIDEVNVLPTSPFDDDLRVRVARAIYGNSVLSRYALDPQKPIRIVVENGHVTLYGVVDNKMDSQVAETQAKSVPNVFSVENKLMVANSK